MTRPLYTQQLESAFEEVVGTRGASRTRYDALREQLRPATRGLMERPAKEVAPMLALPARGDDLHEIESLATAIAGYATDLVVVGMGGSSMGAEALFSLRQDDAIALHIVDNIDPTRLAQLVGMLPWRTTAFVIVSKSGNTVETHAQLAVLVREAKARLGVVWPKHFAFITIPNDNPLHRFAIEHGIHSMVHDTDLCGRFSILSAVGLLPAAVMGVDIRALRHGAQLALATHQADALGEAGDAAALHVALMEKGGNVQVLMHYTDRLCGLAGWHRQCWAESLGKAGHGSLPVPSRGATDQHSQLQLYLEGPADKYFTALVVDSSGQGASIAVESADARFEYLHGHTLGDLLMAQQRATNETLVAHGCPLRSFTLDALDESRFGALVMQFQLEILFTAHLLGVNAYDQPAVEAGKKRALAYLSGKGAQ